MKNAAICTNLDAYLDFVTKTMDFVSPPVDFPLLSDEILACFSNTYKKIKGHRILYHYALFKNIVKTLSLPFHVKFFFRRLPADAYYVHVKNKYFDKQGIYVNVRQLRHFYNLLRLLIHELCHYYVCTSPHSKDVFRMTNEYKQKLSPMQVNETSDIFAMYPTEYFAMCLERVITERLSADCPRLIEYTQAEQKRLVRAVNQYTQINKVRK